MPQIIELDPHVSNQIAAGEVVERPLSVIKELLENALDAGAKNIEVRIKDGGLSHMVVQDDGCGMDAEDIDLAVKRFATSKIKSAHDLNSVATFGFRGEALPSIASVAKLAITSRQAASSHGHSLVIHGGEVIERGKAGALPGTRITVRDLFFNVPARLKFVKSKRSEMSEIDKLIRAFALMNKHVAFKFFSDDKAVFALPFEEPDESFYREALLLGKDSEPYLYQINGSSEIIKLSGVICAPLLTRRDTRGMHFFVNRRRINDKRLLGCLKAGFRSLLEVGRNPICALHIEVDAQDVDVNVHPQKSEVRFADERRVHSHLINLVADFLSRTPWLHGEVVPPPISYPPKTQGMVDAPALEKNPAAFLLRDLLPKKVPSYQTSAPQLGGLFTPSPPISQQRKMFKEQSFSELRAIGQVQSTYLLLEGSDGLVVVDQHAAHERVMYEKIRNENRILPVSLLVPESVSLSFGEMALFKEHQEDLQKIGIESEIFSDDTAIIRSLPASVLKKQTQEFINDILADLSSLGRADTFDKIFDHTCATLACHSSIRAGQKLHIDEIHALLKQLDGIDFQAHCPHGRPIVKSFAGTEIKRWFDRT